MAHTRQSGPDYGLDFQVKVRIMLKGVPPLLWQLGPAVARVSNVGTDGATVNHYGVDLLLDSPCICTGTRWDSATCTGLENDDLVPL